jgi:hypothetical protein
MLLRRRTSRRRFLGMGAALAVAAVALGFTCEPPPPDPSVPRRGRVDGPRHLAWVWQFARDGSPEHIVPVLAQHNLGVMVKTHDGTDWMGRYDQSPFRVYGPDQVAVLANYFETYGVPFHAWCLLKGLEPLREAEMCAQVIAAGARSMTVDVEPHSGFWAGRPEDALLFGQEFRRRRPDGVLHVSVDPRPWELERLPLVELASLAAGFVPQVYWETFNTSANRSRYEESGFPPGDDGITPEFLLDTSYELLSGYRPLVQPAGQGASNSDAWSRFVARARDLGLETVSAWRYGVTDQGIWRLLSGLEPLPPITKGARVVVTNTGSCLNVRQAPSVQAPVVLCMPDGVVVTVLDGPVEADGYRWWLVDAEVTQGWSAEGEPGGVRWLVPQT